LNYIEKNIARQRNITLFAKMLALRAGVCDW